MIDRAHPLPIARQARLLGLARSSVYYRPAPGSERDLALMAAIDEIHTELPFYGARRVRIPQSGRAPRRARHRGRLARPAGGWRRNTARPGGAGEVHGDIGEDGEHAREQGELCGRRKPVAKCRRGGQCHDASRRGTFRREGAAGQPGCSESREPYDCDGATEADDWSHVLPPRPLPPRPLPSWATAAHALAGARD
jgi:putative transposase